VSIFLRSQAVAIIFSLGYVVYLNILVFLNDPSRGTLMYMDGFIWGLAIIWTIIYMVIVRKYIGRQWLALPLIFLPYLLVYHYLFTFLEKVVGIGGMGYDLIFDFIYNETTYVMVLSVLIATVLGIVFSKNRPSKKSH